VDAGFSFFCTLQLRLIISLRWGCWNCFIGKKWKLWFNILFRIERKETCYCSW